MSFRQLWIYLFGTSEWLGLDIGFYVSLGLVVLLIILMNIVFWSLKPLNPPTATDKVPVSAVKREQEEAK